MITEEWQRRLIKTLQVSRRDAKFVNVSDSGSFIDPGADLGKGFVYVNLYDEEVDNHVFPYKGRIVMIHNTYLSSFAYNLLLSWLYGQSAEPEGALRRLLVHNFKKFFAEQLWRAFDDVASRALLLETLLFEQVSMVPVFAAQSRDQALAKASNDAASIMSLLLSMHELGHFMLDTRPAARDEFETEAPEAAKKIVAQAAARFPPLFVDEIRCDLMAVLSCVEQNRASLGLEFVLRVVVFAFAAYAAMFSLVKSARAYRDRREHEAPEAIDLKSIKKNHRENVIPLGQDRDFAERARLVAVLCEAIARQEKIELFETAGAFPLPPAIAADLMACTDEVLACEDGNARSMSILVAEALFGHPDGMEYLYLRSKTFRSNRDLPDRV